MTGDAAASLKVYSAGAGLTLFKPQAVAATTTVVGPSSSTGINLNNILGATGDLLVVISGVNGASATTCDVKITESATTNGTYTDITGAAITQIAATNSLDWSAAIRVPWAGRLGFIRMSATAGAGTNGPTVGGVLLYEGSENLPVQ